MARRQAKSLAELRWVMYCHKCRWVQSIDWTLTPCKCGNVAAKLSPYDGMHVVVIANNKALARVMELTTLFEKHWALVQKPGELPGVEWFRDHQRAIDEGWKLVEDFVKPRKVATTGHFPAMQKEIDQNGKVVTEFGKARKRGRKVAIERSTKFRVESSVGNLRTAPEQRGLRAH